jgi:tryptophan-rich sensory protein
LLRYLLATEPLMTTLNPRLSRTQDIGGLIFFLVLCFAVSAIGGFATAKSVTTWYQTLNKPSFNPPDWLFGPVWTALYAMMAIAGWRVWRIAGVQGAPAAMSLLAAQLFLNLLWSILFFGMQNIELALIDILLLLAAIFATMIVFFRHDRLAGWLFAPYAVWVSFATLLNAAIWRLN